MNRRDPDFISALDIEHATLKRRIDTVAREHSRLQRAVASRADLEAHRVRLWRTINALERHFLRLQERAETYRRQRQ